MYRPRPRSIGMVRKPYAPKKAKSVVQKVTRLERVVRSLKPELKFIDLNNDATNVSTANGLVTHLTALAGGTTQTTRVGNAIRISSIQVNWLPVLSLGSVDVQQANSGVRFFVVQDTQQAVDAAPTAALIFDQPSLPFTNLRVNTALTRFKILYDSKPMIFSYGLISVGNPSPESNVVFHRNIEIPCNITTRFNGSATSDIEKNGIYLVVLSNCLISGSSSFDYFCTSRIVFSDV